MLLYGKLSSMVVLSKATAAETPYRIRACSSPGDDDEDVDLDDDDDDDYDDDDDDDDDDKEGLLTSTGALHAAADRQRLAPAPRLGGRDDWEMEELGQNSSVGAAAAEPERDRTKQVSQTHSREWVGEPDSERTMAGKAGKQSFHRRRGTEIGQNTKNRDIFHPKSPSRGTPLPQYCA